MKSNGLGPRGCLLLLTTAHWFCGCLLPLLSAGRLFGGEDAGLVIVPRDEAKIVKKLDTIFRIGAHDPVTMAIWRNARHVGPSRKEQNVGPAPVFEPPHVATSVA